MQTLMIQGTTSDAGKSTLVAGLCRVFADLNWRVAPFKPQNMALNSAVTDDGGEIGRAQALQATAARVPAQTDFNPILLKPNSDTGAQVILHGKAISNMEAHTYHDYKKVAINAVLDSYQRLSNQFQLLIVEGAGSPAEINLRENDIANMGFAEAVDCPVIIIADIDKGGVFAHLVGTLALLSETEQARVKGFVINRFRGDISLLQSGLSWLEEYTQKPVLGVLPYLHDLSLDAEDAIDFNNHIKPNQQDEYNHQPLINICVLLLPHISNHTDFDSLRLHPQINISYIKIFEKLPACDLLILPGSKNVIQDLALVQQHNWASSIQRHLRYGGKVLGICGGLQMLGQQIIDPFKIESSRTTIEGLKLADFSTELKPQKQLKQVKARTLTNTLFSSQVISFTGYEIHCGSSSGKAFKQPLFQVVDKAKSNQPSNKVLNNVWKNEGFISDDGQIIGTYLHGLFDEPEMNATLLNWLQPQVSHPYSHPNNHLSSTASYCQGIDLNEHRETQINRLADACRQSLDIDAITKILRATHD